MGPVLRTELLDFVRAISGHTSDLGVPAPFDTKRRLFLRQMGPRTLSRPDRKIQHDDPYDFSVHGIDAHSLAARGRVMVLPCHGRADYHLRPAVWLRVWKQHHAWPRLRGPAL